MKERRLSFVRLMANGGLVPFNATPDGFQGEAAGAGPSRAKQPDLARRVHAATAGSRVIGHGKISQLTFVPGQRGPTKGKEKRWDVFRKALNTPETAFLFVERAPETRAFDRLNIDVCLFDELLKKHGGPQTFGGVRSWRAWRGLEGLVGGWNPNDILFGQGDDDEFAGLSQTTDRVEADTLLEVVNLAILKAYAALGQDRRQAALTNYMQHCERCGELNGDFVSVPVKYYRKFGLPGRRCAWGPSVHWLTKDVSFGQTGGRAKGRRGRPAEVHPAPRVHLVERSRGAAPPAAASLFSSRRPDASPRRRRGPRPSTGTRGTSMCAIASRLSRCRRCACASGIRRAITSRRCPLSWRRPVPGAISWQSMAPAPSHGPRATLQTQRRRQFQ